MKKIILPVLIVLFLAACEEKVEVKRIQWTSSSPEAIGLFEEFLYNNEYEKDIPEYQEELIDSILVLDPDFAMANSFNGFGSDEENRKSFMRAYEARESVSDLEKRLIEANYERYFNGNQIKQDSLVDLLVSDYPDLYQLRLISGDIKNNIDIKACQKRWEEALEINPNSFAAILNLAKLHFPVIASFKMLELEERDLDIATKYLNDGEKLYPNSSRWTRYLGNVYRSQGKLNESKEAYEKAGEVIIKYEGGKETNAYSEIIYLIGHVNTALGEYNDAREAYYQTIGVRSKISDKEQTLFSNVSMRTFIAETFMYQKDFSNAILVLSEAQSIIENSKDVEEIVRINLSQYSEFYKFLVFGHSQKQEETLESIDKIYSIIDSRLEYFSKIGLSSDEMERRRLDSKSGKLDLMIWHNILFGEYDKAREMLSEYEKLTKIQLAYNPRAQIEYNKYLGYINLMEGNPQESVNAYNKIPNDVLTNDNYHMYFLALAKKAVGELDESEKMFITLANDNFAGWENAVVKNLAKAQIKTNI